MDHISVIPTGEPRPLRRAPLPPPPPSTDRADLPGHPQLYLPSVSTSTSRETLLEVVKVQCSHRRTWFIGDSTIDSGTILMHYEVDPLFLVMPILMHLLNSSSSTSFQPLSDLLSTASSSPAFALHPPFTRPTPGSKPTEHYNEDVARLLALRPVRRVFRLGCERKAVPLVNPEPDAAAASASRSAHYYRPSVPRILALLQRKVEYLAAPEQFEQFDHLVRALGRDGLLGADVTLDLLRAARIRAACEHLGQWLPPSVLQSLIASYDFAPLSEHLANRTAAALAAAAPIVPASKNAAKAGAKRRAPAASRGVEALKKVNTSSMNKLTSFFKLKDQGGGGK